MDREEEKENLSAPGKAVELMKKMLTVGIGTVFMTEDSIKGLVSEFKLPKEMIGGLLESANKVRKEFIQDFSRDLLNRLSEKTDPVAFLSEFFNRNEIELNIKMKFNPKPGSKGAPAQPEPGSAAQS